MRFEKVIVLITLALVLGWGLGASKDAAKIGFVDVQRVMASSGKGKAAMEELERKAGEAQARIRPMAEQLQQIQDDLRRKGVTLSDQAKQAKQLDMAELRSKIESQSQEEENQLKIDQQRLFGPLQERFIEVVREVGQENDFSVIMMSDAPGLVYRREALDITDLIIKTFDSKG